MENYSDAEQVCAISLRTKMVRRGVDAAVLLNQ